MLKLEKVEKGVFLRENETYECFFYENDFSIAKWSDRDSCMLKDIQSVKNETINGVYVKFKK